MAASAAILGREQVFDDFYGGRGRIQIEEYRRLSEAAGAEDAVTGSIIPSAVRIDNPITVLDAPTVEEKMRELSRRLTVVTHGDSTFEITTTQPNDSPEFTTHYSTYASSISNNPGNLAELAILAALHPDQNIVYIASFGNGGSSALLPNDRRYVRQTGRFTHGEGDEARPIESLENLHHALLAANIIVRRLMGSDSAGGNYSMGLGVAAEPGQLDASFFSEGSGFVNLKLRELIFGIGIGEQFFSARHNRRLSHDTWRVDYETLSGSGDNEMVWKRSALAEHILATEGAANVAAVKEYQLGLLQKAGSLATILQGLSRGPRSGKGGDLNPLVEDTNALIARHPDARLTFGLAEYDPLYRSPADARRAIENFLAKITVGNADVRALLYRYLTHAYHTTAPQIHHAIRDYALQPDTRAS